MSGMAEVLAAHRQQTGHPQFHDWCTCGWVDSVPFGGWFSTHQAAMLTAAGFGPIAEPVVVTEAQWQEAADIADYAVDFGEPNPVTVPKTYSEADLRDAKAQALEEAADQPINEGHKTWLRARAAAVRGEG